MFGFDVSDNLMITWVIYRVGAFPADSFLVNSPEKTTETAPPRNPEWSGVQNVHLWLRDSSGNESENLLGETVYFLP